MSIHLTSRSHNVASVLWATADATPAAIAVRDLATEETRTYAQLRDRAAGVARGLEGRGLRAGDRVALLMQNSCAYVEVFLGALTAGLVVVPLNTRLTLEDFSHMLEDSGASALFTEPPFIEAIAGSAAIDVSLVVDVTGSTAGYPTLEDVTAGSDGRSPVDLDATALCSLMYTSGTTGSPKAVMLSHGAWTSVSDTCRSLLDFHDGIRVIHPAPLTHGAGFLLLPTLAHAGTNLLAPSYDPADVAARISSGEAQGMFLVPSMIRMLLDALPDPWQVPNQLGWIYYAGSPIDPGTFLEATEQFGGRLVQSFAQMETPMFLTSLGPEDHLRALKDPGSRLPGSAGRVIPGRRVRIVDEAGDEVPTGEVGEVRAQAPQTMTGYWQRPDETSKTLRDGWLSTGDLGYFDRDGYLFLVDRLKDMIVTGGSNVYAREVEEVLLDLPTVDQVAVVGLPHRIWGEEVTAVLVTTDGEVDEAAAKEHCRDHLAGYKVPKRFVRVESLPRNAYGKVLKRELRTTLQEKEALA